VSVNGRFVKTDIELWDASGSPTFKSCWPAVAWETHGVVFVFNPEDDQQVGIAEKDRKGSTFRFWENIRQKMPKVAILTKIVVTVKKKYHNIGCADFVKIAENRVYNTDSWISFGFSFISSSFFRRASAGPLKTTKLN
jgi:hypothetical protein